MTPGRVSVIIPARNERFLQATIDSLLAGAAGDVEILACLDGYWPDPPLREDRRLRQLHWGEAQGMRPCENVAASVATGEFLLKLDAHCLIAPEWDARLKESCEPGDLVVPTRHSVDPATWTMKPRDWNYHVLTYPYHTSMYGFGMHAVTFDRETNQALNAERADVPVDDLMSFQGSCWFQRKADFDQLGPLDHEHYYFYQEAQEVGLRVWMTGGRCRIDKRTWYAHLHKGNNNVHTQDGRIGRGFYLSLHRKRMSEAFTVDFWLHDRWPGATRTFVSFIDHFAPLLARMQKADYRWPDDWRDFEKYRLAFENRPAEAIPAHL